MARPAFRIRCIQDARAFEGRMYMPGFLLVQRRVAWLFWLDIAACYDRAEAEQRMRNEIGRLRRARLKPRLVAEFDDKGMELTDESRRPPE
ncbi:hypothetical protein [Burkholderia ubonensis]|uniref:hypothetical protein n=1 Tax=Burkholderia ubonensis TaxID=101571 RepID=UPI00075B5550|nr:hypothetical protein [Burkholderia ubonensis]KVC82473.1 hypothetical protein WI76_09150 [Burkholderia ubonensis]KVS71325.1 hypothetical protein WK42_25030 [Burkholderia ubonensis]KVS88531.1 hypothetical protein WK45_27590 [Burkholderia ubonensis]KVS90490.1 hypothetical protein WK44_15690 [Burkholderia ubonensis]